MYETKYKQEGWAPAEFSDLKEGDHIRWTPNKRYRTDKPKTIVGVIKALDTEEDGWVWLDIHVSGARRILMAVKKEGETGVDRYVSWTEVQG